MKTSVYIGISLDGFIARKDGDIEWLVRFESEEVHNSYQAFIKDIDAILIGRGSFEKVLTFPKWPYEKPVFVASQSIKQSEVGGGKATILSGQPKDLLKHLLNEGFSNIYVDGGKLIQSFLQEDCIDEMVITIVPVLIGEGIPLFGPLSRDIPLEHIQTNTLTNGLVKNWYKRKHD